LNWTTLVSVQLSTVGNHLANDRQVAGATQNQALAALPFLYKHLLDVQLPWLDGLPVASMLVLPLRIRFSTLGARLTADGNLAGRSVPMRASRNRRDVADIDSGATAVPENANSMPGPGSWQGYCLEGEAGSTRAGARRS
jgi:hypothetical protein